MSRLPQMVATQRSQTSARTPDRCYRIEQVHFSRRGRSLCGSAPAKEKDRVLVATLSKAQLALRRISHVARIAHVGTGLMLGRTTA